MAATIVEDPTQKLVPGTDAYYRNLNDRIVGGRTDAKNNPYTKMLSMQASLDVCLPMRHFTYYQNEKNLKLATLKAIHDASGTKWQLSGSVRTM